MSSNTPTISEKTWLIMARLFVGLLLVVLYVVTGMDGVILMFAAFLFGLPLEYLVRMQIIEKEPV